MKRFPMQMPRLFVILFVLLAGLDSAARAQVEASLVAAESSIQPGRPFTVALRLQHDPHWHTYWLNPGTGLKTELQWDLPAGFTAG
ncbi:MAG: thiol:disulfide interchange protein, partial [Cephaloticoccus sp.]